MLGIDPKLVVSIMVTAPLSEPPSKRSRKSELSAMTTSQTAINLLKRGCFPLYQPARREWGEDGQEKLQVGNVSMMWPPTGWKDLSGDLNLLQWGVAAYRLTEATRDTPKVLHMLRSEFSSSPGHLMSPHSQGIRKGPV